MSLPSVWFLKRATPERSEFLFTAPSVSPQCTLGRLVKWGMGVPNLPSPIYLVGILGFPSQMIGSFAPYVALRRAVFSFVLTGKWPVVSLQCMFLRNLWNRSIPTLETCSASVSKVLCTGWCWAQLWKGVAWWWFRKIMAPVTVTPGMPSSPHVPVVVFSLKVEKKENARNSSEFSLCCYFLLLCVLELSKSGLIPAKQVA